ncbi:MAG TPA: FecR family protein [Bacteroidales bacterium]|nr:FecR family protein [Bacteroidales bacterium]
MKKNMDELLARYFGGNASLQDMELLEQWLSAHPDNQKQFDELTVLYQKTGCPEAEIPSPNTVEAKASFIAYMNRAELKIPFYKTWMFQAASILILMALSVSIWYFKYSVKDVMLATTSNRLEKVLPDGTRLFLSENSQATYRSDFGKKDRIVHLKGKATIHAGHQGHGRLQIKTDRLIIEDIGTIFTISAYPDSPNVVVSVKEGQVNLFTEKRRRILLRTNEVCRYNKKEETFRSSILEKVQPSNVSNLPPVLPLVPMVQTKNVVVKHYYYEFESKYLYDVVETISKEYSVNIEVESPEIGMQEITVHFDHERLEVILEVIAETMNLKVKKIADGYRLCKN